MRKSFLAALCAAVCVPGVATSSENFPLSFTALGIEGSYVDSGNSDDKSTAKDNLDNYFEGGLNLSHQFNPNWSVLLQASYAEPETRTTNLDIDLMRFSAGGRVHPTKFRMAGWRPLVDWVTAIPTLKWKTFWTLKKTLSIWKAVFRE